MSKDSAPSHAYFRQIFGLSWPKYWIGLEWPGAIVLACVLVALVAWTIQ